MDESVNNTESPSKPMVEGDGLQDPEYQSKFNERTIQIYEQT